MFLRALRKRKVHLYGMMALAALFFLLCLPLLPSVSRWRGDERFYTDAVIGMAQSGDYLTPTYSDGALRFKKPILSYWVVLLSYKALGVNYLASRLPFLVAGTLVVGLTYWFALTLIRRRPEALVASAVMASNLTVFHTAIRSTPDMLLTLFILISMIGFAHVIFRQSRSAWHYGMAFLGVALAVATKGLFGLLPLIFVVGYVHIAKPPGVRLRDLTHVPVLIIALPVACFWFILAFALHGGAAFSDFWGDQVGERFSGSKFYMLSNAGVYLASFILQMLPWSAGVLVVLYQAWRRKVPLFFSHRREALFAAGWLLFLYGIFIFGNIQRTRYFLPAYPHLSVLLALLLCAGFRIRSARTILVNLFRGLCWCVAGWGLVLVVGGVRMHFGLVFAGLIFSALSFYLISRFNRWAPALVLAGFGALLLILFTVTDILVRPVFFLSPAPAMSRELLALCPSGTSVAMKGVSLNYVSQVRVLSGGVVRPVDVTEGVTAEEIARYPFLVCPLSEYQDQISGTGGIVGRAVGISGWRPRDFLALASERRRASVWAARRQEYVIVSRSSCPAPSGP